MGGNDDGLRVGAGTMLGGGVGWVEAVDVRWEWGGGWLRRGLLGEGSSDGRAEEAGAAVSNYRDGGVFYFYKFSYFFVRV